MASGHLFSPTEKTVEGQPLDTMDHQSQRSTVHGPETSAPSAIFADEDDETMELMKPCSPSGLFWKSEYDEYKSNSARDVRRLVQFHNAVKAQKEQETSQLLQYLDIKDKRIAELQQHVARLEKSSDAMPSSDTFRSSANEMSARLNAMAERLGSTEDALARTRQQLHTRNVNTDEPSPYYDMFQESELKAKRLENENQELKETLAAIEEEVVSCQSQRDSKFREREAKLQKIIQYHRQCLKGRNQMLAQLQDERDDLRAQVSSVHKRLSILAMSTGLISHKDIGESIRRYYELEGPIT